MKPKTSPANRESIRSTTGKSRQIGPHRLAEENRVDASARTTTCLTALMGKQPPEMPLDQEKDHREVQERVCSIRHCGRALSPSRDSRHHANIAPLRGVAEMLAELLWEAPVAADRRTNADLMVGIQEIFFGKFFAKPARSNRFKSKYPGGMSFFASDYRSMIPEKFSFESCGLLNLCSSSYETMHIAHLHETMARRSPDSRVVSRC